MLDMTEEQEAELAQRVLKAEITPYDCEQLTLPQVKHLFMECGFSYHEMQTIFERWDMNSARKKKKTELDKKSARISKLKKAQG